MSTLTGTRPMIRLALRRDRIRLPVWVLAILTLVYGSAAAVQAMYDTPAKLATYAQTMQGSPAVVVMNGPPIALDTVGGVTVYEINVPVMVAVALMAVFLGVRHTRGEEEAGRTELVRSAVVGRHAPTAAALAVVGTATVVVAVGITGIMLAFGLPTDGSLAYGAAIGGFGVAFTAVAVCAAQVTAHARGALGLGAAFLAVAYSLRAAGDVGSGVLSRLSPLGWVQAVRPFGEERWWPLVLLLAFAGALLALAATLTAHRDVGHGLLSARAGRSTARPRLGTASGLALRLQRGPIIGWAAGMFLGGVAFGSLTSEIRAMVELNEDFAEALTSVGDGLVDAFFATMLLVLALVAAGFTVSSVLRLRSEETAGRVEPLLAAGLSRRRWLAGGLAFTLAGTVLVLGAGGLGVGVAAGVVLDDLGQAPRLLAASLAYVPAALTLAGLGVLLLGWLPRGAQALWAALAFCFVAGWLGTVLRFPDWVLRMSPYSHVSPVPAEAPGWLPLLTLSGLAVALVTTGVAKCVKRDIA